MRDRRPVCLILVLFVKISCFFVKNIILEWIYLNHEHEAHSLVKMRNSEFGFMRKKLYNYVINIMKEVTGLDH